MQLKQNKSKIPLKYVEYLYSAMLPAEPGVLLRIPHCSHDGVIINDSIISGVPHCGPSLIMPAPERYHRHNASLVILCTICECASSVSRKKQQRVVALLLPKPTRFPCKMVIYSASSEIPEPAHFTSSRQ